MTPTAWLLLAVAALVAATDWWAAERRHRRLEALAKPAIMVALMGLALALDTATDLGRALVLLALAASLVGDLALLRADRARWFATGLAAFLAAHVAYIAALVLGLGIPSLGPAWALGAAAIVMIGGGSIGRRIVAAVRQHGEGELVLPVGAYIGVISVLVVAAWTTARPTAMLGALAFYASDSLLAWDRFVRPIPHRSLLVLPSYHLAQALLVLALAR